MGLVYRAQDRELDRIVAIKTIDRECAGADSGTVAARLQQEATAAARLTHPGIVTIYDVAMSDGVPYIVMEYVRAARGLSWSAPGRCRPTERLTLSPRCARPSSTPMPRVLCIYLREGIDVVHAYGAPYV